MSATGYSRSLNKIWGGRN